MPQRHVVLAEFAGNQILEACLARSDVVVTLPPGSYPADSTLLQRELEAVSHELQSTKIQHDRLATAVMSFFGDMEDVLSATAARGPDLSGDKRQVRHASSQSHSSVGERLLNPKSRAQ